MIDKVEFEVANGDRADSAMATGVVFIHGGKTYTAKAKKDVIISAGTIASPAILERSGVGSKDLCNQLDVRNVVDNPHVGENLQDHLMCGFSYEVKDDVATADVMRDPAVIQKVMEQYQSSKSGPLANGAGYSFAYTPLSDFIDPRLPTEEMQALLEKYLPPSCGPKDLSDAQHQAFVRSILSNPSEASSSLCLISVQFDGTHGERSKDIFAIHKPENYIAMIPQLAHPLSRGSIHIKSTDPNIHPIIKPNYLSHPLDAEILARHMMQVDALAKTSPISDLLKPNGVRLPRGHDASTLERAIEAVRASGTSNYHPAGTCAMKPRQMGGVLDSRMKVYGTRNLRVCDASIFPIQVRGNIQSTVYAVAEKGSDILKEDMGVM
jgi:choline dehydrogenase-like flavoprotein